MPNWRSSYEQNNYGDLFYSLIRIFRPEKIVELGTLTGYSAYHIAKALKDNAKGSLDCYDLWENYLENYGLDFITKVAAEQNLKQFQDLITLNSADAIGVEQKYNQIDILHVDLNNDGEILEKIIPVWIDKVQQLIIIEGGSLERDQAAATTDFKKLPINKWLNDLDSSQAASLKGIISDQAGHYVKVEGKKEYKEKPIVPWLKSFSRKRADIEYFTIEPFPSLTLIRKK
jgi:hypothetical protein